MTGCSIIDPYYHERPFYSINNTPRDYSTDPASYDCWKLKSEEACLNASECVPRYTRGAIVEMPEGGYEEDPIYKDCAAKCNSYILDGEIWSCKK